VARSAAGFVFEPLRDQLGFRKIARRSRAGGALGPEMMQFFRAIGVNLQAALRRHRVLARRRHCSGWPGQLENVDRPSPGVEITLSRRGEWLIRTRGLFSGYYKSPEQTRSPRSGGWSTRRRGPLRP